MSARAATSAPPQRRGMLAVYRDDGPLARALGAVGGAIPLPAVALVLGGAVPLLAVIAATGDTASDAGAGVALGWALLCAGAASGRPTGGALGWLVPPLLRVVEYAGLLWIASLAGDSSLPAAFALLGVVAFRHYDLVYRLRHRGVTTPAWVDAVAGGWDGRLVVGFVLLVAGLLPAGFYVIAALLAVVLVGESAAGWSGAVRGTATVYEDEEDEGQ